MSIHPHTDSILWLNNQLPKSSKGGTIYYDPGSEKYFLKRNDGSAVETLLRRAITTPPTAASPIAISETVPTDTRFFLIPAGPHQLEVVVHKPITVTTPFPFERFKHICFPKEKASDSIATRTLESWYRHLFDGTSFLPMSYLLAISFEDLLKSLKEDSALDALDVSLEANYSQLKKSFKTLKESKESAKSLEALNEIIALFIKTIKPLAPIYPFFSQLFIGIKLAFSQPLWLTMSQHEFIHRLITDHPLAMEIIHHPLLNEVFLDKECQHLSFLEALSLSLMKGVKTFSSIEDKKAFFELLLEFIQWHDREPACLKPEKTDLLLLKLNALKAKNPDNLAYLQLIESFLALYPLAQLVLKSPWFTIEKLHLIIPLPPPHTSSMPLDTLHDIAREIFELSLTLLESANQTIQGPLIDINRQFQEEEKSYRQWRIGAMQYLFYPPAIRLLDPVQTDCRIFSKQTQLLAAHAAEQIGVTTLHEGEVISPLLIPLILHAADKDMARKYGPWLHLNALFLAPDPSNCTFPKISEKGLGMQMQKLNAEMHAALHYKSGINLCPDWFVFNESNLIPMNYYDAILKELRIISLNYQRDPENKIGYIRSVYRLFQSMFWGTSPDNLSSLIAKTLSIPFSYEPGEKELIRQANFSLFSCFESLLHLSAIAQETKNPSPSVEPSAILSQPSLDDLEAFICAGAGASSSVKALPSKKQTFSPPPPRLDKRSIETTHPVSFLYIEALTNRKPASTFVEGAFMQQKEVHLLFALSMLETLATLDPFTTPTSMQAILFALVYRLSLGLEEHLKHMRYRSGFKELKIHNMEALAADFTEMDKKMAQLIKGHENAVVEIRYGKTHSPKTSASKVFNWIERLKSPSEWRDLYRELVQFTQQVLNAIFAEVPRLPHPDAFHQLYEITKRSDCAPCWIPDVGLLSNQLTLLEQTTRSLSCYREFQSLMANLKFHEGFLMALPTDHRAIHLLLIYEARDQLEVITEQILRVLSSQSMGHLPELTHDFPSLLKQLPEPLLALLTPEEKRVLIYNNMKEHSRYLYEGAIKEGSMKAIIQRGYNQCRRAILEQTTLDEATGFEALESMKRIYPILLKLVSNTTKN